MGALRAGIPILISLTAHYLLPQGYAHALAQSYWAILSLLPLRPIHLYPLPPIGKHWSPLPVTLIVPNSHSRASVGSHERWASRCSKPSLLRPWLASHQLTTGHASASCRDNLPRQPQEVCMRAKLPGLIPKGDPHLHRPYHQSNPAWLCNLFLSPKWNS